MVGCLGNCGSSDFMIVFKTNGCRAHNIPATDICHDLHFIGESSHASGDDRGCGLRRVRVRSRRCARRLCARVSWRWRRRRRGLFRCCRRWQQSGSGCRRRGRGRSERFFDDFVQVVVLRLPPRHLFQNSKALLVNHFKTISPRRSILQNSHLELRLGFLQTLSQLSGSGEFLASQVPPASACA